MSAEKEYVCRADRSFFIRSIVVIQSRKLKKKYGIRNTIHCDRSFVHSIPYVAIRDVGNAS